MERPKVQVKQVWAIKDLLDDEKIKELEKSLPEELKHHVATMLKQSYLCGFNSALQRGASYLNDKELYHQANDVLKIGEQEV